MSLTPTGNAGEQARPAGAVGRARLRERLLRIEPGPGLDVSALGAARSRQARVNASAVSVPARSCAIAAAAESWFGVAHCRGSQLLFDPEPDIEQPARPYGGARPAGCRPASPSGPVPAGKRQARHVEHGPQRVEHRRAGVGEPARRLARGRQGQDRVEARGPVLRGRARLARRARQAARKSSSVNSRPSGDLAVFEQIVAQQRRVPVAVPARGCAGPRNALWRPGIVGDVGAFRRQLALDDLGPGGREPRSPRPRARPCPRAARRPNAACGIARDAAAVCGIAGAS